MPPVSTSECHVCLCTHSIFDHAFSTLMVSSSLKNSQCLEAPTLQYLTHQFSVSMFIASSSTRKYVSPFLLSPPVDTDGIWFDVIKSSGFVGWLLLVGGLYSKIKFYLMNCLFLLKLPAQPQLKT